MLESNKVYRNFNRKNRFLGIVDYKTLTIFLGYMWIVWEIGTIIFVNMIYCIYFLMFLTIPIIGLIYVNRNEEDISHVIYVIIRYLVMPKRYVFKFNQNRYWLK